MPDNKLLSPLETARYAQCNQVLALMASGRTQAEACEQAGISVRQFKYWIAKEGGMDVVRDMVKDTSTEALLKVMQSYGLAIEKLIHIATGEGVRYQDQLGAIRELRVIMNEVIIPAVAKGPPEADQQMLEQVSPATFSPGFLGTIHIKVSPEQASIIENKSAPDSRTESSGEPHSPGPHPAQPES